MSVEIPLTAKGDVNDSGRGYLTVAHVPNLVFDATLTFTKTSKTRSSVRFHFTSDQPTPVGSSFSFLSSEFAKVLKSHDFRRGQVRGRWTFFKKGSSITLGLAK